MTHPVAGTAPLHRLHPHTAAGLFASRGAVSWPSPLEVPCPHASQHGHLRQRRCVLRRVRTVQGVKQHEAVRPDLDGARLQQPVLSGCRQQAGQQALGGFMLEQPGAELAQHREVEAAVGQVEGEQVFPVDPAADCLGSLTVTQALAELHQGNKGEAPGRIGGLTKLWIKIGKVGVGEHGAEPVPQEHIRVAAPERGTRDAHGVVGHGRERL